TMSNGRIDVKNWAAMVIARSKISTRTHAAATRSSVRPIQRERIQSSASAAHRGNRCSTASTLRASTLASGVPSPSHSWSMGSVRGVRMARDEREGPGHPWIDLDQHRLQQQAERYGQQGAERAEEPGPEHEGQEGQR